MVWGAMRVAMQLWRAYSLRCCQARINRTGEQWHVYAVSGVQLHVENLEGKNCNEISRACTLKGSVR